MPQRDGKNSIQVVHLNEMTLSGTTPEATDWVDTRGFDTCTFVVMTGVVTDAGTVAGIVFEVQEADDTAAASAVAVDDLELIGSEADLSVLLDTDDNIITDTIGYVGDARYARIDATGSTLTNAIVIVIAILTKGARMPTGEGVGTSVAAT
jgi:hypothetical protein